MENKTYFEDLASEARRYADLRVDELKLKATNGLSLALGQILSMLLVIAVLVIVLGLLAYALFPAPRPEPIISKVSGSELLVFMAATIAAPVGVTNSP